MANQFTTRQQVLDTYNAAFRARTFLLDYANKTLVNRDNEYDLSNFGNGYDIQVRRRPTTKGQVLNIRNIVGPLTKVTSSTEAQTITVSVDQFYYNKFVINTINNKLFLNGSSADSETVYASTDDLSFNVHNYLYSGLLQNANILALAPSSSLSNMSTLGSIDTVAKRNNMPDKRCLMTSHKAGSDLRSSFGVYYNKEASTPSLADKIFAAGYFDTIGADNVVVKLVTGTASAVNGSVTVTSDIANGATAVPVTNAHASIAATWKVNDPISFDASDVTSVARGTFQPIGVDIQKPSLIVAPGVDGVNGYVAATKTYTAASGGGTAVLTVAQAVQTSGNFQTIATPSDIVATGVSVIAYDDHVCSFMVSDTGINYASPKLVEIENATNIFTNKSDINIRYTTQGNLDNETNGKQVATLYGSGFDQAYLIRVMHSN